MGRMSHICLKMNPMKRTVNDDPRTLDPRPNNFRIDIVRCDFGIDSDFGWFRCDRNREGIRMDLKFNGFSRIMVNAVEAWSPERAIRHGVLPDIGFRRDDGWSIGAPADLEFSAFNLWPDQWTHFVMRGDHEWRPIDEYRPDCGYDLDDPKHPTYRRRMSARADAERKRRNEDG